VADNDDVGDAVAVDAAVPLGAAVTVAVGVALPARRLGAVESKKIPRQ